ncbi:MAG: HD domain-containing protein [Candidatus Omnitrophica bacterium]|nr:HD domain-containing protein [Candidatus Omnitrophota bacterium]
MRLIYDLHAIDKTMLINSKQKINKLILNKIAQTTKKINYIKIADTVILNDIKIAFKDPSYAVIFSPEIINKKIINLMKKLLMPKPIISELKIIKKTMPYTYRHILVTAILATKISLDKQLKGKYDPIRIARLGIVHDIGKSRIPPKILQKSTPLTETEHEILKTHALIGYVLLHYYCGKKHALYDCASFEHHERLDGSGYPRQAKKINKYSQVIAVVDVFDALIAIRPYRKTAFSLRAALDLLLENAEQKRLNKSIVHLLISLARQTKPNLKKLRISQIQRDTPPPNNVYGKIAKK